MGAKLNHIDIAASEYGDAGEICRLIIRRLGWRTGARNLSALWDALTDSERPIRITITGAARARATMGTEFERLLKILEDARARELNLSGLGNLVVQIVD